MGHTVALLQVVVALAGASGGNHAVNAVGEGLALVEAQRQIEARPPDRAGPDLPTAAEIAADPSLL
ncbi:MAG TPA: hypothetical protein VNR67_01585, partial [Solirubrobacterales bacterium]|nr:hypothetical protein [Solirubrobacterales bacterium]